MRRRRLFASVASRDEAVVEAIPELVRQVEGWDLVALERSPEWQRHAVEALSCVDAVVFVRTEASLRSPWCKWELDHCAAHDVLVHTLDAVELERLPGLLRSLTPVTPG